MRPSVTFLTPILNPTVASMQRTVDAIRSVQTNGLAVEHIIIDGGSDGFDVDVGDAVIIDAPGANISEALTIGWKQASGRFVMVMNAGDSPTHGLSAAVERIMDADTDVVVFPVHETNDQIIRPKRSSSVLRSAWVHAGMLARTELVTDCGGYARRYQFAMDWEWLSRAEVSGVSIEFVPDVDPIVLMEPFGLSRDRVLSSAGEFLDVVRRDVRSRRARIVIASRHLLFWARAFLT